MIAGLEPRGFRWVIANRLAVAERIGGHGFQHRRVRREEEIHWLVTEAQITTVITLLPGPQNLAAYRAAGLATASVPIGPEVEPDEIKGLYACLDETLADPTERVLVHREWVDDILGGLLGGYLIHAGYLDDPILAAAVIQQILGRALGPEGRRLIPDPRSS